MSWNGTGSNNRSRLEERQKINAYLNSLPSTYSVLMPGDWNMGVQAIKNFIHADGFRVLPGTDKGVDHTGAILVKGTSRHGLRYGSDHPLQFMRVKCERQ